nr:1,2-phenylacetyl-CoA epoxidase subunit PaaD [Sphingosinicella soli]
MAVLASVPDPEIPAVSLVDLGIIRDVLADAQPPRVLITPTYTGCPATAVIQLSVREALDAAGMRDVTVETCLSPPWTTAWITPEGREKLRAYGIDPPPDDVRMNGEPATCPRCNSRSTHEISRFGSTPCKALWQCNDCLEPFDRFKCH